MELVRLADVRAAALAVPAHHTPWLHSTTADLQSGRRVVFKAEHLQRGGAFKFRGAYNHIHAMDPPVRRAGVAAYSSGNHAQAVALVARMFGIPATVCMPADAPAVKVAATRGYGADVVFYDRQADDRVTFATRVAAERGQALVPPYDDPLIIAGAGTVALELLADVPEIEALVVPVGGGGLISGCAVVAKALDARIHVIGVETEGADDARQSLAAGQRIAIPPPATIADGIRTTQLGEVTWPHIRALVDEIIVVSDAEVEAAMRFLALRCKQVVEPTGAVAAAAVLARKLPATSRDRRQIGVVLSGGNADPPAFARIVATPSEPHMEERV